MNRQGENRSKDYYDSNNKPQGSTAKLPAVDLPEPPEIPRASSDQSDLVFTSTHDNDAIEASSALTGTTPPEGSASRTNVNPPPNALAPTVDAFQLTPPPKKPPPGRKYASQTRKLSLGPSNLMLATLWTIAIISVGWAIYFYATQP